MAIEINVACAGPPEKAEALAVLFRDLARYVEPGAVANLRAVIVVPDANVAETVNHLVKATSDDSAYTPSPLDPAPGVAVPLDSGGVFRAVIVLGQSLLQPLGPTYRHQVDTVSTILEELLHVWVYSEAWRRRGSIQFRSPDLLACDADLLAIATRLCDEYAVIRTKADLLASAPLVEMAPGAGLGPVRLYSGGSPVAAVSQGIADIEDTVRRASNHAETPPDAWSTIVELLYRGVTEPLARSVVYLDAAGEESTVEAELMEHPTYREVIHPRWLEVLARLRRVFETRLAESEKMISEIRDELRTLLAALGVTYRRTDTGECWVRFQSRGTVRGQ